MAVRVLHTSDWHIGKTIRGLSRADEHRAVLAEVVEIARSEAVDLILVCGDLFETSAPTAESESIAWQALLELADVAGNVVVIAGNHDNPRRLDALRDLMRRGNIHVVAEPRRPDDGGVIGLDVDGVRVEIAALPFVSKRGIIRANELMHDAAHEHAGVYSDRVRSILAALDAACTNDAIRIITAHGFVLGGGAGGGERPAHLSDDYAIPAQVFPVGVSYVALGHLHRAQKIPGPTAIYYSGSLLQLDFGDPDASKSVSIVELEAGAPAAVTQVPLTAGRPLRTIVGTLDELRTRKIGDEWLRVRVREARRADLADEVRTLFGPQCVDVFIEAPMVIEQRARELVATRSSRELYGDYLNSLGVNDTRLISLFDELLQQHVEGAEDEL
ncbi:MAG: exonuclease SbcD [Verrucomicrobiales bacterium]|jgi:exonuclease SbcD